MTRLEIDYTPNDNDLNKIREGLITHTANAIGEQPRHIAVYLKDETGKIHGGCVGWLYTDSLHIDYIWVSESIRSHGYGTQLLSLMEDEARKQRCQYVTLNTFGFQAEAFYSKLGYSCIGIIHNYIHEHPRVFMRKSLL